MSGEGRGPEPTLSITPMLKTEQEKHNFGAIVTNLDLDNISDVDVKALSNAIWTHKLVVVKGQQHIHPVKQWELVTRFDPEAPLVHSHGDIKSSNEKGGVLSKGRDVLAFPGAENVRVVGKGYQGKDHYGIMDKTITKTPSHDFHDLPLSDGDFEAGHTRFQRWHIDAPLYDREPAWFTTLRCIQRPTRPEVTIHWDDGSGYSMSSEPGLTAFFSNVQTYELMTEDEKKMADHSWVEERKKAIEELGAYEGSKVKRYPMVWTNPVAKEKAFMVHSICVRRMFLRSSVGDEPKIVDDLVSIRQWLKGIQNVEEGDIVMWANYQMFHSAVVYHEKLGPGTMHQANIGGSKGASRASAYSDRCLARVAEGE